MAKSVDIFVNFKVENCDAEWVKYFAVTDIAKALQKLGLVISESEIKVEIPISQADILTRA